jgi:hypothetical protein
MGKAFANNPTTVGMQPSKHRGSTKTGPRNERQQDSNAERATGGSRQDQLNEHAPHRHRGRGGVCGDLWNIRCDHVVNESAPDQQEKDRGGDSDEEQIPEERRAKRVYRYVRTAGGIGVPGRNATRTPKAADAVPIASALLKWLGNALSSR